MEIHHTEIENSFNSVKNISIQTDSLDNSKIEDAICSYSQYLGTFQTNERKFIRFEDISSAVVLLHIFSNSLVTVKMDCLDLQRFPMLESFKMDSKNCNFVKSFVCVNHNHIKSITFDRECFQYTEINDNMISVAEDGLSDRLFQISQNPLLETISVEIDSFTLTRIAIIQGVFG